MTSSKKKRGKQRRAAKAAAVATHSGANNAIGEGDEMGLFDHLTPGEITEVFQQQNNLSNESTHVQEKLCTRIVEMVQGGDELTTSSLVTYQFRSAFNGSVNVSYESSGVLTVILKFLQRCESETFARVMADVRGNLKTPSTWIKVVSKAYFHEESCRMQIAENIGTLVRCMCNDTKRLFFKSNNHWKDSIVPFVELIYTVLYVEGAPDEKRKITDALFEHEGLLKSIVQWGFWGEEHRPDITKELGVTNCTSIMVLGRDATAALVRNAAEYAEDGKCILEIIATTSIVSNQYDPNCMVSYVTGIIRLSKDSLAKDIRYADYFYVLRSFIIGIIDFVDKGVITEIIDFGINYSTGFDIALFVAMISTAMILQETNVPKDQPSDGRVAFAIRAGLIEMCLIFIERYGAHESFGDETSLFQCIGGTLEGVHKISLHQKTAKVIGQKKKNIEKELACLEKNAGISNNTKCRELLDMVRSILNLNGAYCCRCNKTLGRMDVKQCNGCNRMTYCSKVCQKEDWLNGHNVTCNKQFAVESAGQFQGRLIPKTMPESERDATKLEQLEVNIIMIQLNVFIDHSETILRQASSLNISLCDCVVEFDLRGCPPIVKTLSYNEVFRTPGARRAFEDGRSEEHITCIYNSNFYNGEVDEHGNNIYLKMQKFFPLEWLFSKKYCR